MSKIKLGILAGGSSIEREVSFKSCDNVLNNLDKDKYDIHIFPVPNAQEDKWIDELVSINPDIIVSTLHGGLGENGSMQGLLHCLNIPYVGSKVLSSALCMDKKSTKTVLEANHIQTARDVYIKRGDSIALYVDEIRQIGFPLIVKPNRGGSSIGITIVNDLTELDSAVNNIVEKYDDDVIAEKFIQGREVTCCMFEDKEGIKVLAVLEVNKKGDIFDYSDKYENGVSSALTKMPLFMQDMVKVISEKAFKLLKCKDYACVDMIIQEEQIYVIEVNTLPGLTANSLLPMACRSYGMSFGEFLNKVIEKNINDK